MLMNSPGLTPKGQMKFNLKNEIEFAGEKAGFTAAEVIIKSLTSHLNPLDGNLERGENPKQKPGHKFMLGNLAQKIYDADSKESEVDLSAEEIVEIKTRVEAMSPVMVVTAVWNLLESASGEES